MKKTSNTALVLAAVLLAASLASAQTSQQGDTIDIEVYNPIDGSNAFCVAASEIFEARVYFRPGTGTTSCTLSCSPPDVAGGSANVATAVVDLGFDDTVLSYVPGSIQNNTGTAAVQGLAQEQNLADGRIGWALAGTWSTPGDPSSNLQSPCDTVMLTTADWLFGLQLQAAGSGMSTIHLRGEADAEPFALSFADLCDTEAFKRSNGGIDEARGAVVMVADDCSDVIFFDTFGTGDTARWTVTE